MRRTTVVPSAGLHWQAAPPTLPLQRRLRPRTHAWQHVRPSAGYCVQAAAHWQAAAVGLAAAAAPGRAVCAWPALSSPRQPAAVHAAGAGSRNLPLLPLTSPAACASGFGPSSSARVGMPIALWLEQVGGQAACARVVVPVAAADGASRCLGPHVMPMMWMWRSPGADVTRDIRLAGSVLAPQPEARLVRVRHGRGITAHAP